MKMKINLIDNWFLGSDEYNFILYQEKVIREGNKKGEKYVAKKSFFPNLSLLIEYLANKKIFESEAKTLEELKNYTNDVILRINFKELKKQALG